MSVIHTTMQIEPIPPHLLRPHPCNSRVHPAEQLAALAESYRAFGFNGLVVIDEDNTILAGHGRTQAATIAGLDTVPCKRVTGWTDDKKRAYVIADNQIADANTWDLDMLTAEVDALQRAGFDMASFGVDVASLLPPADPPNARDAMRQAETSTDQREAVTDEAAYRDEMADKRTTGQAPIVPIYAEHHQAFIVVCDNEIDEAWIRQRLGLNRPQQSYTDCKILTPNVITVAQLRALIA